MLLAVRAAHPAPTRCGIYVKRGLAYDDVKMDLETAIEGKGLIIGAVGDLGDMLDRTGNDLSSGPPVYQQRPLPAVLLGNPCATS